MSLNEESEAAIVNACEEHGRQHWKEPTFRQCVAIDGRFVKYANYKTLRPVHDTMKYISELADDDQHAPRIPKVLGFFRRDCRAYLVMEYIEHTCIPGPDLDQRVAGALQWLRSLPAPDGATIGPIGGGPARHMLFKDYEAPLAFSSIDALERYMNKVRTVL